MYKFLAVIMLLIMAVSITNAESLWSDTHTSPLADKKAFKVGDIVTITIEESASSSQQASTDTSKNSSLKNTAGSGPLLKNIPSFSYSGNDSVTAKGSTTRSSKFIAKMTAIVKKVNDNGTLEIEGSKFVQTNSDKEEIKLTGTIRRQDIASDNTISSSCIANAKITHSGSGPVGSRQKEGIISKIFRILF